MTTWDVQRALSQREDLAAAYADPKWVRTVARFHIESMTNLKAAADKEYAAAQIVAKWRDALRVAETFTLTADLQTVIEAAAEDLPSDWIAEHHHLYAEHGFLSLARPVNDEVMNEPVQALTWHHGSGWSERVDPPRNVPGIEVNLWSRWSEPRTGRTVWMPAGSDFLPYGLPSLGFVLHGYVDGEPVGIDPDKLSLVTRIVLALQSFMRQELPGVSRWPVPRADARRMFRLGFHQPTVTVIDLRRRQTAPREDGTGRVLTHRHLVRGHWHHYWVGTGHNLHSGRTDDRERVPVYLSPYLKGPEDAPIRPTPERVHRVGR